MDVYMPTWTAAKPPASSRRKRPQPRTPVVAITALGHVQGLDACRLAGMNAYVVKPIEPSQLYAVLETVLSGDRDMAAAAA